MPTAAAMNAAGNRTMTNFSIGLVPGEEFIADKILPPVPTGTGETYRYWVYDDTAFAGNTEGAGDTAGLRAKGSAYERVTGGGVEASGLCHEYAKESPVDLRDIKEGGQVGIDAEADAAQIARSRWLIEREQRAAALVFVTGSYAAGNKSTLSGSDQWSSAGSNPLTQRNLAHRVLRRSYAMQQPGSLFCLAVGSEVHDQLMDNSTIIERIKYTQRVDLVTRDNVAAFFGVAEYIVGGATYNSARDTTAKTLTGADIWGKTALFFVKSGAPRKRSASLGYNFYSEPFGAERYLDNSIRSYVHRVRDVSQMKLTNADAGYIILNAIA